MKSIHSSNDLRLVQVNALTVICTATPGINPVHEFNTIGQDLKAVGFNGTIIFDLLCCNGLSTNRFIRAHISDGVIDRSSLEVASNLADDLLNHQNEYMRAHPSFVRHSVLSSVQVKQFLGHA